MCTVSWETVRFRRARSGKRQCMPISISSITWSVSWTWNKKQIDGTIDECISLLDIEEKFRSFGWYALTVKGNDPEAIQNAFLSVRENQGDKPAVIVLDGTKGSGVKCVEEMVFNHMIPVDKELADKCLAELEEVKASV